MRISLKKIATFEGPPRNIRVIHSTHSPEFIGEMWGSIVVGLPVILAHWETDGRESCGVVLTKEVVGIGRGILQTTDAFYICKLLDAEDRDGRKRVSALLPQPDRGLHQVRFRWRQAKALREQLQVALVDPYILEAEDLPCGKKSGFQEYLSPGVQRSLVELASLEGLEEAEARIRSNSKALSDGVSRFWSGISDVDLRGQTLLVPSQVQVRLGGQTVESRNFISAVEIDTGKILHLSADEFPVPRDFEAVWGNFLVELQAARKEETV